VTAVATTKTPALAGDRIQARPARDFSLKMSEAAWTTTVLETAELYGWALAYHTPDSRKGPRGWPDWVLGNPRQKRTIFAELKKWNGRLRVEQRAWLLHLATSGLETAVWRPCDLDTVLAVLGPRRQVASWDGVR
jgi:hypothetical protein